MKEMNPATTRICGSSIEEGESETRIFESTNHIRVQKNCQRN